MKPILHTYFMYFFSFKLIFSFLKKISEKILYENTVLKENTYLQLLLVV